MSGRPNHECPFCDCQEPETYYHYRYRRAHSRPMLQMILLRLSIVVATFGCIFWFDVTHRVGYINMIQLILHDIFLNMPQPAFMVLSHHNNKRPGLSNHTVCTERLDAHVWRSDTLTSIDGTRQFGDAALHLCIQSARTVRTDCTSRPPTCSTENHDHLSCIRQIPPVFRKWFAHHILDTNAAEALQSGHQYIIRPGRRARVLFKF